MLSAFNRPKKLGSVSKGALKFDSLSSAVEFAFSFQTKSGPTYTKDDVQNANVAYEAFMQNTNNLVLANNFLEAAKICEKYKRDQFSNVVKILESHIKTLSPSSQTKNTPKI